MHQCRSITLGEHSRKQDVRLRRRRIGLEEVTLLEQDRIDLIVRHEFQHRNLVLLRSREFVEVLVAQDDARSVFRVVRLVDVGELNRVSALGTHTVVLDAATVFCMDLVKSDVVVLGRRVHLDRDVDQTEGYRAFPNRAHASHDGRRRPFARGKRSRLIPNRCVWMGRFGAYRAGIRFENPTRTPGETLR